MAAYGWSYVAGFIFISARAILYLISNVRMGVINAIYGDPTITIGNFWMGFFCLVSYGVVLGALYKRPTRAKSEYDVKRGSFYGSIAGVVGGIAATISWIIGISSKLWEPISGTLSVTSLTTRLINEIVITVAFGAIFGVIYSMYYNSTPGKGIIKGLSLGLIIYLISGVRFGVINLAYNWIDMTMIMFWIGFFTWIVYGLVLGYLYKKE